jgi:hypothetical protein
VILPDINILVHAHNSDSSVHLRALEFWQRCLAGPEGVGLAFVTILGFLRITTHRRILERPLPVDDVLRRLESWLELPHVHIPVPADGHFSRLAAMLRRLGTAGNLTTDAHLATLAMERGYVLYSTDADFARFPGLRWINPCQ